jgi:O-antigen ligase
MFFLCLLIAAERFHEWPHLGTPLATVASIPLTFVKCIGIATVGNALMAAAPNGAAPRLRALLGGLFGLFALLPVIITVGSGLPFPSIAVSYFMSIGLMIFAARRLVSTYARMRTVVRTVVAVVGLSTFWAFKQRFIGHTQAFFVWGVSGDSNYEALSVLIIVPLALSLARRDESRRWRQLGALSAMAMAATVLLTESRGGLIGLSVACLSELFARRGRRYKLLFICAITVAVLAAPSNLWRRMQSIQIAGTTDNEAAGSTKTRWQVLLAGAAMIRAHPFFGVGLDLYKPLSVQYNPSLRASGGNIAHNTYMQVGAEGGLVTLTLFLSLMAIALKNCRDVRRLTRNEEIGDLASALRGSILAYAAAAAFLSASYQVFYWLLVIMSENLRDITFADDIGEKRRHSKGLRPVSGQTTWQSVPDISFGEIAFGCRPAAFTSGRTGSMVDSSRRGVR